MYKVAGFHATMTSQKSDTAHTSPDARPTKRLRHRRRPSPADDDRLEGSPGYDYDYHYSGDGAPTTTMAAAAAAPLLPEKMWALVMEESS